MGHTAAVKDLQEQESTHEQVAGQHGHVSSDKVACHSILE